MSKEEEYQELLRIAKEKTQEQWANMAPPIATVKTFTAEEIAEYILELCEDELKAHKNQMN